MDVNSYENIATVAVIILVKSGQITENEYIEARDNGTFGELLERIEREFDDTIGK